MKILCSTMSYDYGKMENGSSCEEYFFYYPLLQLGHEVLKFDFITLCQVHGVVKMREIFLKTIDAFKPDVTIIGIFEKEFDKETIKKARERCKMIGVCSDNTWRFNPSEYKIENVYPAKEEATWYDWWLVWNKLPIKWFKDAGINNIIETAWGFNPIIHRKSSGILKDIAVSHIGQIYGIRREYITRLEDSGIVVESWGKGSKYGYVSIGKMAEIFNRSKINLNFCNPFHGNIPQRKARPFEITGSGGFLLTDYADGMEDCFEINKEMVVFKDKTDLVDKVKYYLEHDKERDQITEAGYKRAIACHNFIDRWKEIFTHVES